MLTVSYTALANHNFCADSTIHPNPIVVTIMDSVSWYQQSMLIVPYTQNPFQYTFPVHVIMVLVRVRVCVCNSSLNRTWGDDTSWAENVDNVPIFPCASFVWLSYQYKGGTFWCWGSLRYSPAGYLFTNEVQKPVGSYHTWHFCHTYQPCSCMSEQTAGHNMAAFMGMFCVCVFLQHSNDNF